MSQDSNLVRQIGVVSATAIVISNMIGTAIFTTSGYLAGDLGSPGLVVGIWVAGAFIALCGALCYSELGVNMPRSGGEYIYLTEAWGPSWGFIDGWVSFFAGFSAPIATAALAIAAYLAHFRPALDPEFAGSAELALGPLTLHLGEGQLLGCVIVIVFTALNFVGVGAVAKLQNVLTGGKLLVLLVFLVMGFAFGEGSWEHFSQPAERTSQASIPAQFAVSLIFVYLGYSGWNAAVYVAEEIRDPARTLPRALIAGTLLVAVFYTALNVLFIYANPVGVMTGTVAVAAQASAALFGPERGGLFAAAMAAALLATVNVMCMVGPRVYFAMARDRAFFAVAARIHPRWKSPWIAVLAQGVCCCVLILTGTFKSLLYYIGFTLNLFSALAVLALFQFRRRPGWRKLAWVNFGYPLIPALYIAINLWVFFHFLRIQQWEGVWSLATVLGGALVYHLYIRHQPRMGRAK